MLEKDYSVDCETYQGWVFVCVNIVEKIVFCAQLISTQYQTLDDFKHNYEAYLKNLEAYLKSLILLFGKIYG